MIKQYHGRKHVFYVVPHNTDFDAWVRLLSEKNLITGEKTPLVVDGTQTQVLADSIAIAARAKNQFTTLFESC